MRIAMIAPSLSQTGPGIVARDLCEQFVALGHHCVIFYFDDILGLHLPCEAIKIVTGDEIIPENWDIVHSHGFRPDCFVHKNVTRLKQGGCKLITTLHQPTTWQELRHTYPTLKSLVGSILWKKALSAFNKIVVLNSNTLSSLPNNLRLKSQVIFNGRNILVRNVSEKDRLLLEDLRKKYSIIGTCSGINKRKGLEQIIRALPRLPEHAFVAVGTGPELENLKMEAEKLGVRDRCLFIGFRSNSTDYLRYFDVFIMCTRSEGFPLAFIEAASQGIPTVLSDIPILKAIVSDDIVNFYHLDDIDSLTEAITKFDRDKGRKLRDFYLKELTAETMAKKYLDLYNSTTHN